MKYKLIGYSKGIAEWIFVVAEIEANAIARYARIFYIPDDTTIRLAESLDKKAGYIYLAKFDGTIMPEDDLMFDNIPDLIRHYFNKFV